MKEPNSNKAKRIKELEDKVEVLGSTIMNLYQDVQAFRTIAMIFEQSGLLQEHAEKVKAKEEPAFDHGTE